MVLSSGIDPYMPKGLSKDEEELLIECFLDTSQFCKVFMPETFFKPFSKDHMELFKVLDDNSIQKAAFAAPRGWGKTAIFNNAYPVKRIVFQESQYIVPVSASGLAAKEYSENMKAELLNNRELIDFFGSIKSTDTNKDQQGPFSTQEWVTSTGIKILPRGAGQQIRGRQYRSKNRLVRPDLYIIDDLEDDESVENEELRKKLKRWFFSSIVNSVELSSPNWRIIVIGTILHEDSLLANLMDKEKYPEWYSRRFELCNDKLESNWPEHLSTEKIKEMHADYKRKGLLDIFYREFRNIAIATEDRGFKPEMFHDYTITEEEINKNPRITTVILADLARTMVQGNSMTALVAVSVDTEKNIWYVRDIIEGIMSPGEMYDEMFAMAERTNALVLAPEVTGLRAYVTYPLKNEMIKRGKHYVIVEVNPRQSKTGPKRSAGLLNHYRTHAVLHNPNCCGRLEELLLTWPRPKSWDIIDALSGMIFVLEDGAIYFSPPETDDPEDEYKELMEEYDEPLEYEELI